MTNRRLGIVGFSLLLAVCLAACDDSTQRSYPTVSGDASERYREILSRYELASFQIHFRHGAEGELVWTKAGDSQRYDLVAPGGKGVGGSSLILTRGEALTCYWGSDENRELIDAACVTGGDVENLGLGYVLRRDLTARHEPREEIAELDAECFHVALPILDVGTVCFSADGEPLRVQTNVQSRRIELYATEVEADPTLSGAWLVPIIPYAIFGEDTSLKQVLPSELALPDSRIARELLGED